MAGFETLLDRIVDDMPGDETAALDNVDEYSAPDLPKTTLQAAVRGLRGRCPSCGKGHMFPRLLKPMDRCPICGQDWTAQQADDFPAYVAIIVTGHILAPVIIFMINETDFSMWTNLAIIIILGLILLGSLLQPAKGAIIAMQWWMGLHGFEKPPRPAPADASDKLQDHR
ncbi:DUF983 domain-containing protein [uncultured Parasphingorhabdus sp.]|uniref:DUF983 domain-containing protein n=1 Tax=uncultured Parasphingorhabdus sp. TaxID=2709694 RepID=UPI0030DBF5C4|tara:strand:- start:23150 stop:23659 length:510 start_codon:yes stop_codon:yes gene_type:complete